METPQRKSTSQWCTVTKRPWSWPMWDLWIPLSFFYVINLALSVSLTGKGSHQSKNIASLESSTLGMTQWLLQRWATTPKHQETLIPSLEWHSLESIATKLFIFGYKQATVLLILHVKKICNKGQEGVKHDGKTWNHSLYKKKLEKLVR